MKKMKKRSICSEWESTRENSRTFAWNHAGLLYKGDIKLLEQTVQEYCENANPIFDDEIYEEFLLLAIKHKVKDMIPYLCEKVSQVPLLHVLDIHTLKNESIPTLDNKLDWEVLNEYTLSTPFITSDPEIFKMLITGHNWSREATRVMWADDAKLYIMDATPKAAALATGNVEYLQYILNEDAGWEGMYFDGCDSRNWWAFHKKPLHMAELYADDIKETPPCRLRSPEEAILLSGNVELIKKTLESQEKDTFLEHLYSSTIEYDGTLLYQRTYKPYLPETVYWLDEEASLYFNNNCSECQMYYELDKIIESANYVLLASYLNDHEDLPLTTIEYLIDKLENLRLPKLSIGMFEEKCRNSGVHCIPYNQQWFEDRKNLCLKTLAHFVHGKRAFVLTKDEDLMDDSKWDNYYDPYAPNADFLDYLDELQRNEESDDIANEAEEDNTWDSWKDADYWDEPAEESEGWLEDEEDDFAWNDSDFEDEEVENDDVFKGWDDFDDEKDSIWGDEEDW